LIFGLILLGTPLALMVQTVPAVRPPAEDPERYLATTRTLLHRSVQSTPGDARNTRDVALTADDLTAGANFALLRKHWRGHAQARIHGTQLNFAASVRLPFNAMDLYLNLEIEAEDAMPKAVIQRLRLGRLSLPGPIVRGVAWLARGLTPLGRYAQVADQLFREVRIGDERLRISLTWDQDTISQARTLFTDVSSQERLIAYHQRLAHTLKPLAAKRYVNLGALMQPLFALAHERSQNPDNDPVEENRALILVLGAYANGRDLLSDSGAGGISPKLPLRGVMLNRRIDLAQHFMGSAALAISGHRALADVVGLAKEINDTHSGSGFSFTDLAADRAGAVFGKTAVLSREEALRIQDSMRLGTDESVFMPSIRDLPENLGPAEFAARFGDIQSESFQTLKRTIEERIMQCVLYRRT
jgi:hypothetical protein